MRLTLILLFIFSFALSEAATVDTVIISSPSMHISKKCVVILPDSLAGRRLPVVYLLHGFSGDYGNWIKKVPQLKTCADLYRFMIVCPDGDYSSWYLDSPLDSSKRYETYISKEVIDFIDAHYPTIQDRSARAITGLSMGGYGGLFLGLRHPGIFGGCGSMSGGVDLNSSRNKFDIAKRIGDTIAYAQNWTNYSVIHLVETYQPKASLAIIFDCGVDDPFYPSNKQLHERMLELKIPHDYIERPGGHSWAYWSNSVVFQLLFFRNYFDRVQKQKP